MCAHLVLFSFKIVRLAGATFVTFWHIRCSSNIVDFVKNVEISKLCPFFGGNDLGFRF